MSKRLSLSGKIALIVGLSALLLLGIYFWGMVRTEAGQEGYDYIVSLGEIMIVGSGGPLILDKRTGNVWAIGFNAETRKVESEYCGHIEELIREEGAKKEIARKLGGAVFAL